MYVLITQIIENNHLGMSLFSYLLFIIIAIANSRVIFLVLIR